MGVTEERRAAFVAILLRHYGYHSQRCAVPNCPHAREETDQAYIVAEHLLDVLEDD